MGQSIENKIRLLLVDDHALFLEGVSHLLQKQSDFTVVGSVPNLDQALQILAKETVDVLLLDYDFGRERATPFVHNLVEGGFRGKTLVVTAGINDAEAVQLIRAGVAGIIHKHHGLEDLCHSIRQVAQKESYLEPGYLNSVFRALGPEPVSGPVRLSEREVRILRLIFQGFGNKQIATKVGLTESGVKSVLRSLFVKIGAKTRSHAVRIALENYQSQL